MAGGTSSLGDKSDSEIADLLKRLQEIDKTEKWNPGREDSILESAAITKQEAAEALARVYQNKFPGARAIQSKDGSGWVVAIFPIQKPIPPTVTPTLSPPTSGITEKPPEGRQVSKEQIQAAAPDSRSSSTHKGEIDSALEAELDKIEEHVWEDRIEDGVKYKVTHHYISPGKEEATHNKFKSYEGAYIGKKSTGEMRLFVPVDAIVSKLPQDMRDRYAVLKELQGHSRMGGSFGGRPTDIIFLKDENKYQIIKTMGEKIMHGQKLTIDEFNARLKKIKKS